MNKINMGRAMLVTAAMLGIGSQAFADGPMAPPSAPTSYSDSQVQKARMKQKQQAQQQRSQKSQEQIEQEQLDRQQYQQPEPVRRDVPEPDDLFDD